MASHGPGEIPHTGVLEKRGRKGLFPGCVPRGKKIGIATSNARELTDDALLALQIGGLFDVVRTAGEAGAGKPRRTCI